MRVCAKAAAAVLAASMSCFATFAVAAESESDAAEEGKAIMAANCGRCHAIGMEDSSRHEEAPPFRVVVKRYPPESLAEALAEGIVSGHPDMPEFVFQPPEIEAILAYLATLQPEAGTDAGDAPETGN